MICSWPVQIQNLKQDYTSEIIFFCVQKNPQAVTDPNYRNITTDPKRLSKLRHWICIFSVLLLYSLVMMYNNFTNIISQLSDRGFLVCFGFSFDIFCVSLMGLRRLQIKYWWANHAISLLKTNLFRSNYILQWESVVKFLYDRKIMGFRYATLNSEWISLKMEQFEGRMPHASHRFFFVPILALLSASFLH